MASDRFAERILRFIQAKAYKAQQEKQLASAMRIGVDEQDDFHAACQRLVESGRVILGSRKALMLPEPSGKIVGSFRGNSRGFGFVIPDTPNANGDLFIPAKATRGAISGDTVSARVLRRGKRGGIMQYEGRVVAIIQRGQNVFVGELRRERGVWIVVPDGNAIHVPITVGDPKAKGAKPGDQVAVELTQYPEEDQWARGVIVKVFGRRGEPGVDTLSIIEQHQLPHEFPASVSAEAREVAIAYDPTAEEPNREDLRKLTVITIDPFDARDFDDAISLTQDRNGTVELGVHIADVAHFMRAGGAMDIEARERSTSIYLPGTVIPMLPELLSNGVCSLQEKQTRLTKSAFITYDGRGCVVKARLANTLIRSTKRLTYEQAGAILDGKPGRTSAKVVALIKDMQRLAKLIRRRRVQEGMLELDLPEVELVFDDDGRVVDVAFEDVGFSHKIIEMFMVEANEAVSRLLTEQDVPHLRRVHDEPRDLAEGSLRQFMGALGHKLSDEIDRFVLQSLLKEVRGRADAFAVNLAVLRSMRQAEYAPTHIGHYALASRNYCHFTSPIRRYPDLTIHRLVDLHIAGAFKKGADRSSAPTEEELVALGELCTANEQRAVAAERELKLVLMLRLLERRLGDVLDGIVTGVANAGVFVQLTQYLIDGLLRFDHLADDRWEVDAARGCVRGEQTGKTIRVGDRLKVVITRINLPARQMDLAPASRQAGLGKTRRPKPAGTAEAKGKSSTKVRATPSRGSNRAGGKRGGPKRAARKSGKRRR